MDLIACTLLWLFAALQSYAKDIGTASCHINHRPRAENLTCGEYATLPRRTIYQQPQYVKGVQECRDLCVRRSVDIYKANRCTHFGFDVSTNICQLYDFVRLRHQRIRPNSSSSELIYNRKCFNCIQCPPHNYGNQLLDNGGFEASSELVGPWDSYNLDQCSIVSPGYQSQNALFCEPRDEAVQIYQPFNACNKPRYLLGHRRFSFDYKVHAPDGEVAAIDTQPYGPSNLYFGLTYVVRQRTSPLTQKWRHVDVIGVPYFFEHPVEYGDFFLNLSPSLPGAPRIGYTVDNFVVSAFNSRQTITDAQNVFVNGNFDNGTIAPWRVSLNGSATYDLNHKGLGHTPTAFRFFAPELHDYCLLQQTLKTTAGAVYKVSFQFKFPNNSDPPLYMIWGDWGATTDTSMDPSQPKYYDASVFMCQTSTTGKCSNFFVATSSESLFTMQVRHEFGAHGIYFFDNFTAVEVQAPISN